jgi:hypothetical protein
LILAFGSCEPPAMAENHQDQGSAMLIAETAWFDARC